jgi:methyl-CpG-binding domain protein 4
LFWDEIILIEDLDCVLVQAKNVIQDLFELCPNAEAATMVEINEIRKVIQSLGLQNKRSKKIKVLSEEYLRDDWTHVSDLTGIGKYGIFFQLLCLLLF